MSRYEEQIKRIKDKLIKAKKADPNLKVFGADSHKYRMNSPIVEEIVIEFERQYQIELPGCYKSFLMFVGNGGISYSESAAGPFYGIYPLGKNVNEIIYYNSGTYLKNDCVIYPAMTDEYWKTLRSRLENDDITDEEHERELAKVYGGILPIGSQGCSYLHGIVINGEYKGRVVNLDIEGQKPHFAFESNFLDWYERWLDEVIAGELIKEGPTWFGYTMGGSEKEILRIFSESDSTQQRSDCLDGILNKNSIDITTVQFVEDAFLKERSPLKTRLLQILTKFDYERAKPCLIQMAPIDLLAVFRFVYLYAKEKSSEWVPLIREHIAAIKDPETFRFCTYILLEANVDYESMVIPFTRNGDEKIQIAAYHALGKSGNKQDYIDTFIAGLNDDSSRVIHATLQALNGLTDSRLLVHYKRVADRFPEEKDYILSNLNHLLKHYGLNNKTILSQNIVNNDIDGKEPRCAQKKWFQFWKRPFI